MNDLVRRAGNGDRSAFEHLYRENVGRVYALCLRLTADAGLADELTQDVFVRAWEKLKTFRGDSAFSSWMHRLTVNLVLSYRRAEVRRAARETAAAGPALSFGQGDCEGGRIDLDRALESLPTGAREVLVLYDIEGYRHGEIAELLGIAPGTSKAQLHRARKLLREALES